MHAILIVKNDEIAKSLKRAISLEFKCSIENRYIASELLKRYKNKEFIFILNDNLDNGFGHDRDGIRLAHFIINRLGSNVVVFGISGSEDLPFPYLKIPFYLKDLYESILKPFKPRQKIEEQALLEKYEDFRSKISHDYFQFLVNKWNFYKFLLAHFLEYAHKIFGIDIEHETNIIQRDVDKVIDEYQKKNNSNVLYDLMKNLKITNLKEKPKIYSFPKLKEHFYLNLQILLNSLINEKNAPENIWERVAENFFLSWYIWRELYFLNEYREYFSDGFYNGCFRPLLSLKLNCYKSIKKDSIKKIFGNNHISNSFNIIQNKLNEVLDII